MYMIRDVGTLLSEVEGHRLQGTNRFDIDNIHVVYSRRDNLAHFRPRPTQYTARWWVLMC